MPTTTNYGWTTPADTDLVKDGASAIRTLGTAIDTTVFNNASAAIAKTLVDAKGDLIVASGADAVARLAVGTNDYVLTADSAATNGVKWAALPAASTSFVGCSLYKTSDTTVNNNTYTKITFQAETYDTNGFHDNSTNNSRITIPSGKAGKYLVTGNINWEISGSTMIVALAKNNSNFNVMSQTNWSNGSSWSQSFNYVIDLAVGDYIELNCYQSTGGPYAVYSGQSGTTFQASYLGA